MSIWDMPEFAPEKKYVLFERVGDSVEGSVVDVSIQRWADGTVAPKITLSTESGLQVITAGAALLKQALAEKRPEVGDFLRVSLTSVQERSPGRWLKIFSVEVFRPEPAGFEVAPF